MSDGESPVAAGRRPGDARFTRLEVLAVGFCFALNIINGAGVLAVSYAAPLISEQWGVGEHAFGLVFSAGLAGMTLGALVLGPLSDVLGRKILILVAGTVIATGMAASSLATGVGVLIALRLWVGFGIGAMLAGVTSMSSEYAPPRYRTLAVTIATAGYPVGAMATAFAAHAVLPHYDWPGLFLAVSALAAASVLLSWRWLPESVEFLLARQPAGALARVNRIVEGSGGAPLEALPPKSAGAEARPSPRLLFARAYRRETVLVWAAFFFAFMTLYFLVSWIPTMAVDAGLPIERAIYAGATYHVGALAGHVLIGWLAARRSLTVLITGFFLIASVLMVACGAAHQPAALFLVEILAIGVFAQGGFSGLYAAAAQIYPTAFRTTGVGWALGAGRLGGVIGPFIGGLLIAGGAGLFANMAVFALPLAAVGAAAALMSRGRVGALRP